jgi:hypothetical protein
VAGVAKVPIDNKTDRSSMDMRKLGLIGRAFAGQGEGTPENYLILI